MGQEMVRYRWGVDIVKNVDEGEGMTSNAWIQVANKMHHIFIV